MAKSKPRAPRTVAAKAPATAHARRTAKSHALSTLVAVAVLLAVGTWAYSTSFAGVFVFDDIASIVANQNIKSLWPPSRSLSAQQDLTVAGRPVACLSLALNYALAPADARDAMQPGGADAPAGDAGPFLRNVWGYHAFNLAVHLLAALVLFGVVRRSLAAIALRDRFGGASTPLAFAVALVWLVHPLHTEAVTYVVQRVESLMGLFYLLTLYCAIRALEPGRARRWWTGASLVACALGMGSKEAMVTAPLMVWLWDRLIGPPTPGTARQLSNAKEQAPTPGNGSQEPGGNVRRHWSFYAALAATWSILIALAAANPRPHSVGFGLGGWTWWSYLQTQAGVVAHYLRLAVVPHPLVFDYDWRQAHSLVEVLPQALLLATLLGFTVFALIRRRPVAFLGAWFFVILAPTSSVLPIPTEVAAEHRMYLPLAAVVTLAVLAGYSLAQKAGVLPSASPLDDDRRDRRAVSKHERLATTPSSSRLFALVGSVSIIAIAATFAGLTHARNRDYWSDETLMGDTVQKRPANARARVAYGGDLLAARRYQEAETQLRVAAGLEAGPKVLAQAHMYLGSSLCAQGKLAEGVPHLVQALALDGSLHEAHALLGEAYAGVGQPGLAVKEFLLALEGIPDNPPVLRRVAWLLATSPDAAVRDGAKAVDLAERAVRLTARQDVMSLESLAAGYAEQGKFAEAAAAAREALALARAQGNDGFVTELQRELALCESGRPLREGRGQ